MGRRTQITKEMILEASYELLEEHGIEAVQIKQIAAKLGCSTQPVSWQFGSMAELKKELYFYAGNKVFGDLEGKMRARKDAIEAFFVSGLHYLSIAIDHPNVFRFINVDDTRETIGESIHGEKSIFSFQFDEEALNIFAAQYDIKIELLSEMIRDIVIYTHGLALMMLFDGGKLPRKEACRMVYNFGSKLISQLGIKTEDRFEEIYESYK
ncbi:MAG: TetR/AcrR family transcriptional regulator [Lachnospiraceae bacterium]|jgi:AcrR family transcriptional regulator|nr:TetR/AcrR family transcriptional regulator [Lachnospiraceae bacterium]